MKLKQVSALLLVLVPLAVHSSKTAAITWFSGEAAAAEKEVERCRRSSIEKDRFNNAFLILQGGVSLLKYRLKDYQVGRLNTSQLRLLRNTIFASYGYRFKSRDLAEHFSRSAWYNPSESFDKRLLTETDRHNINLILYFEKKYKNNKTCGITRNDITGIWHKSPAVPSGYLERYFFRKDGTFRWCSNQMDGTVRLLEYHGTWMLKDCMVEVKAEGYKWLEGGEIVEPYASYGSSYVIEGGKIESVDISNNPLEISLPVEKYGVDKELSRIFDSERKSMLISGEKYYKGPYE